MSRKKLHSPENVPYSCTKVRAAAPPPRLHKSFSIGGCNVANRLAIRREAARSYGLPALGRNSKYLPSGGADVQTATEGGRGGGAGRGNAGPSMGV